MLSTTDIIISIVGLFIAGIPLYLAYRLMKSVIDTNPNDMQS